MIDVLKIERLMQLMNQHGFQSVHAESATEKVVLSKTGQLVSTAVPQGAQLNVSPLSASGDFAQNLASPNSAQVSASNVAPASSTAGVKVAAPAAAEPILPEGTALRSPFVGTFYRSPNPESPAFVDVGSRVKKGQTLCIVEAMKLMNEIESELDGTVVAVLVENGKPVEFDTPLFVIAP
jgi:acetyl-CoA carboxylase biotin carboxyl carrier protein